MKKKISAIIIILLLISTTFLFFDKRVFFCIKNYFFLESNNIKKKILNNHTDCYFANNGVFFLEENSLKFVDYNGNNKWTKDLNFDFSLINHQKNFIAFGGLNLNKIFVYNSFGKSLVIDLDDSKLISFFVNKSGNIFIINKFIDKYKINIYNFSGENIFEYICDDCPISVDMTSDNKTLAITYINHEDINLNSTVILVSIDKIDEQQIIAVENEKENFVHKVFFADENKIIVIGNKNISLFYCAKNNIKKLWTVDVDDKIKKIDVNKNFLVLCFQDDRIKFYNMNNGKNTGEFKSYEPIDNIAVLDNNIVAVRTRSDAFFLNPYKKFQKQNNFNYD